MLLSLVVGDGLFKLALWVSVMGWHVRVSLVAVGLLIWMELLVMVFAGEWLLDGALRSVFARRWRIYCMMLVDGFRWFVGLGGWFVCVSVGQRLWRSLMVEGLLLSLVVDVGLFKVALWRSLLVDGRLFDGVGWCMLVSL